MQKPTVGVPRRDGAGQADREQAHAPSPLHRLTTRTTRAVQARARKRVAVARQTAASVVRPFTSADRALPMAIAAIVAVAALLAFLPATPQGAVSGIQGSGSQPRLAVNGGIGRESAALAAMSGAAQVAEREGRQPDEPAALVAPDDTSFLPVILPGAVVNDPQVGGGSAAPSPGAAPAASAAPAATTPPESAVQDDGTLVTGYAPETAVEDGANLIRTYKVQKGDTLKAVAKKFDVSMMTLWWANKLKKKDLKTGQVLRIPPVSGLVYTVKDTDTLDTVASKFKVKASKVVALNGLEDPTLVVGQVLVLPGAKGAPMPTPKPTPKPVSRVAPSSGGGSVLGGGPSSYSGGAFRWPVIGGNNYISQYFHYGHYAIDIAADYGSRVVSAASGRVIFAGWKSNGGGYQVWVSHGSGLYTTYNHMSAITVSNGENVARGEQVGRIGSSGMATGPHLHFEVWNGRVWDGGTRVNPLRYF